MVGSAKQTASEDAKMAAAALYLNIKTFRTGEKLSDFRFRLICTRGGWLWSRSLLSRLLFQKPWSNARRESCFEIKTPPFNFNNIIKMFPSGFLEKTQFLTTLQYESKLERQIRGVCSTAHAISDKCVAGVLSISCFCHPGLIFSCFCHPGLFCRCSAAQLSASRLSHCLRTDPKRGHCRQRSEGVFEEVL